jgi:hypothetical protein
MLVKSLPMDKPKPPPNWTCRQKSLLGCCTPTYEESCCEKTRVGIPNKTINNNIFVTALNVIFLIEIDIFN